MRDSDSMTKQGTTVLLLLTVLLLSGCGLGMTAQDRLDRGTAAYQAGDYRAAIIDAKNILQDEPDNMAARILLGRSSIAVGDAVSAELELRRAVDLGADTGDLLPDLGRSLIRQQKFGDVIAEISPEAAKNEADRVTVLLLRGDAYLGMGRPAMARDSFTAVLGQDANNPEALLGVVQSYIDERNFLQARQSLDEILPVVPQFAPAWISSGLLAMRSQEAQRAESDFGTAVDLTNQARNRMLEMQALYGRAEALFSLRRVDDIHSTWQRMSEIAPEDSRTLLITARLAITEGDWTDAQQVLHKILKDRPDNRPAQLLLGAVHKENGNLEQAEMYLSAVVAALPGNTNARRMLAETRLSLNKNFEARQALAPLVSDIGEDPNILSMAAVASLRIGEFEEAQDLLLRGIELEPDNIGLQLQLAYVNFRSGQFENAQRILAAVPEGDSEQTEFQRDFLSVLTKVASGDIETGLSDARILADRWQARADVHVLVGFTQLFSGDSTGARASFNRAAVLAPDAVAPIWFLAQLDEEASDFDSAARRYQAILSVRPDETRSMVAMARLAARSENLEEAREWLEKARRADSSAMLPRQMLAELFLATSDFSAAEDVAMEALRINDQQAGLHNVLGLIEMNQRNYREAEIDFERATSLDKSNAAYRLNLARAMLQRGSNRSAQSALEESPDDLLQHIPSAVLLATIKARAGAIGEAKQIASRLKSLHPDSGAPHALEGELLAREGRSRDASAAYDRALATEISSRYAVRGYQIRNAASLDSEFEPLIKYLDDRPLDSDVRIYLAHAYQQKNRASDAALQYEQVLAAEPDNFIVANNLAWNYFRSEDSRAESVARQAYDVQPENSSVVDTLGWILINKGDINGGISLLRDAEELGNGRPEIRYHLAFALAESGNTQEAKRILQEILNGATQFSSRSNAEELLTSL